MMAAALITFAVVALLAVAVGELSDIPLRRRLAHAGPSRPQAQRVEVQR
jgi:hypothetical protein